MSLEVNDNNLYGNGRLIVMDDGSNEELLRREKLSIIGDERDRYHTVKEYDRLDTIAYKYYKNIAEDSSKYWWLIADANNIMNPFDLSEYVGTEILVPDLARIRLSL